MINFSGIDKANDVVTVCLPNKDDYWKQECINSITNDLDKMSGLSSMSENYLFHHYCINTKSNLNNKVVSIRIPGGTVGYFKYDDNNIITKIYVYTHYVVNTYWRNINKYLQKYIGKKVEFKENNLEEKE